LRYLVVGSGGREHAIAWKLSQDSEVFVLPGNPGMALDAQLVSGDASDFSFIAQKARELEVSAVVAGPEAPLVAGIYDELKKEGIYVFGPSKQGAMLEGSKAFAKDFLVRHNIPTAQAQSFDDEQKALEFVKTHQFPLVIKFDGLAAGKGVHIVESMYEAETVLHGIMSENMFSKTNSKVVIEEFLVGKELSVLTVTDGKSIKMLPFSRDHKQLEDGNKGPMTGGMGAFCPVPGIDSETERRIKEEIVDRTLEGIKKDGLDYKGILYCGLMLTNDGPKVIEYNCRFGDPEAQIVLPMVENSLSEIIEAVKTQTLEKIEIQQKHGFASCVVLASKGYPTKNEVGKVITGLDKAADTPHTKVFIAGAKESNGNLLTAGGRVLACCGFGNTLRQSLGRAYTLTTIVDFEGKQFRGDIGGRYARGRTSILNIRFKIRFGGSKKGN